MTGNELFGMALDLIGLRNEDGGIASDTADLEQRALAMINILLAENSLLDCRIQRKEPNICRISSLEDSIDFSDIAATTVLPYGLAEMMVLGEDDKLASDLKQLYTEARENALRFGRVKAEAISEVYG